MTDWDDKDEYWYKCKECDATGWVDIGDPDDVTTMTTGQCPDCEGRCVIEGDSQDMFSGWVRVPSNWQP